MEGRTHLLSATAVGFCAYSLINHAQLLSIHNIDSFQLSSGICLASVIIGGVAPDLDIPESTLSAIMTLVNNRTIKNIINVLVIAFMAFLLLKARQTNYFIPGVLFSIFIFSMQQSLSSKLLHYVRLGIQVAIILGLAFMYIKTLQTPYILISISLGLYVFSKHRGISHTIAVNAFAAYTVYYSLQYYNLVEYSRMAATFYMLGAACHLLLNDFFTNRGIPSPLYPLDIPVKYIYKCIKSKSFSLENLKESLTYTKLKFLVTFDTGSPIELVISGIAFIFILYKVVA